MFLRTALAGAEPEVCALRLVACHVCHTQYDVSEVSAKRFPCRCGETLENRGLTAVDAQVERCGACGALAGAEAERCDYCGSTIVRDAQALSLICPECYARTHEDARFCTACGVSFRPEAVRIDGYELPCPACGVLMPARQVSGVGLNECGRCHGLWAAGDSFDVLVSRAIDARRGADPAELEKLRPRVTGSNPCAQRVQYRKCPVCEGFMQRRNFRKSSGVIIDVCRTHGTWLDADELERIAGFILSGGTTSVLLREVPRAPRPEPRARLHLGFEDRASRRERSVLGSLVDVLSTLLT